MYLAERRIALSTTLSRLVLFNIMKIERINENKLRITIPMSYFIERNINFENFDYNSEEIQSFFIDLMETLDEEYGFSFLNSQMLVEAMPGDSDDVILTLTRSNANPPDMSVLEKYLLKKKKSNNKREKNFNTTHDNAVVVEFKTFDDVCSFVRSIKPVHTGFNSLYKLNDNYFLIIDKRKSNIRNLSDYLITYLDEFGQIIYDSDFYEGYLNEYGKIVILGNAIDVLWAYFCN